MSQKYHPLNMENPFHRLALQTFNGKFHHIQDYPLELDQDVLPRQFFNLFPN